MPTAADLHTFHTFVMQAFPLSVNYDSPDAIPVTEAYIEKFPPVLQRYQTIKHAS